MNKQAGQDARVFSAPPSPLRRFANTAWRWLCACVQRQQNKQAPPSNPGIPHSTGAAVCLCTPPTLPLTHPALWIGVCPGWAAGLF